jgi:hypothetical protein
MKIWARVGITFDVNETVWETDPQMAMLTALYEGKAKFDGDTYVPEQPIQFDFYDIPIKAQSRRKIDEV